jgi:hypothetical protein
LFPLKFLISLADIFSSAMPTIYNKVISSQVIKIAASPIDVSIEVLEPRMSAQDRETLIRIESVLKLRADRPQDLLQRFGPGRRVVVARDRNTQNILSAVFIALTQHMPTKMAHLYGVNMIRGNEDKARSAYFYSISNNTFVGKNGGVRSALVPSLGVEKQLEAQGSPGKTVLPTPSQMLIYEAAGLIARQNPNVIQFRSYSPFKSILLNDQEFGCRDFMLDYIDNSLIALEQVPYLRAKVDQVMLDRFLGIQRKEIHVLNLFKRFMGLKAIFENHQNISDSAQSLMIRANMDEPSLSRALALESVDPDDIEAVVRFISSVSKQTLIPAMTRREQELFIQELRNGVESSSFSVNPPAKFVPILRYMEELFQNDSRYSVGKFHRGNGALNGPIIEESYPEDINAFAVNTSFIYPGF